MRLIKKLAEQLQDEVSGVCEYAKDALEYKSTDPQLADMYYKMANAEYEHVRMLHEAAVKAVKEAESLGIEYPERMRNTWEAKHSEIIEKMADAKVYLGMYR